jgi:hypothetical protein
MRMATPHRSALIPRFHRGDRGLSSRRATSATTTGLRLGGVSGTRDGVVSSAVAVRHSECVIGRASITGHGLWCCTDIGTSIFITEHPPLVLPWIWNCRTRPARSSASSIWSEPAYKGHPFTTTSVLPWANKGNGYVWSTYPANRPDASHAAGPTSPISIRSLNRRPSRYLRTRILCIRRKRSGPRPGHAFQESRERLCPSEIGYTRSGQCRFLASACRAAVAISPRV